MGEGKERKKRRIRHGVEPELILLGHDEWEKLPEITNDMYSVGFDVVYPTTYMVTIWKNKNGDILHTEVKEEPNPKTE